MNTVAMPVMAPLNFAPPTELPTAAAAQEVVEVALADSLVERIAKLVTMNVPNRQIAAATGINMNKIGKVVELPKIQERVQQMTVAQLEEVDEVNQGWDAVESEAVGTVLEALKMNPDPDYALRAAAVANKAVRHGIGNETIHGKTTTVAVIELSAVFIEKLQTMQIGMEAINTNAKRVDTLDVMQTQHLFRDSGVVPTDELFGADADDVEDAIVPKLAYQPRKPNLIDI